MARKELTKTILDSEGNAHEWRATQWGAEKGWDLFCDSVEVLGGAMARLMGAARWEAGSSLLDTELDGEALASAVQALTGALKDKGGVGFLKRIFVGVWRDNLQFDPSQGTGKEKGWTFNQAFQGNYREMLEAAAWLLWGNFGNLAGGSPESWVATLKAMFPAATDSSESSEERPPGSGSDGP